MTIESVFVCQEDGHEATTEEEVASHLEENPTHEFVRRLRWADG